MVSSGHIEACCGFVDGPVGLGVRDISNQHVDGRLFVHQHIDDVVYGYRFIQCSMGNKTIGTSYWTVGMFAIFYIGVRCDDNLRSQPSLFVFSVPSLLRTRIMRP